MLFRYRARNYPETLSLEERAEWLEHCRARLFQGEAGHFTLDAFNAELAELRQELADDDAKLKIIAEVESFARELEDHLQAS